MFTSVCYKPYHMNNGYQQMWAEIKNLWNYALTSDILHTCINTPPPGFIALNTLGNTNISFFETTLFCYTGDILSIHIKQLREKLKLRGNTGTKLKQNQRTLQNGKIMVGCRFSSV